MKNLKLLIPILLTLFLASCSEKKQSIENFSPDKKISITVDGKRPNSLDPWILEFKIKSGDKTGSLATEFHAGDLNAENVKFNWLEADFCEVTLTEQDDTKRSFLIRADEQGIKMQEQKVSE